MSLRRIVSLTLFLSVAVMLTSSIILYIVPHGRVAYWSDWTLWGLSKTQWGDLHTNSGLLMLIAAFIHLYYNWRPVTSYLKNKARQVRLFTPNFNAALAVVALFVTLTLLQVPPLSWLQDLGARIKDAGTAEYGEPPYGHAELSSLRVFLRNVGLDDAAAEANLAAAGIQAPDPETKIVDLAHANGLSPQALYELMRGPGDGRESGPQPIPETMPRGTGRKNLTELCTEYGRDPAAAVRVLEEAGLTVDPQAPLKEVAETNGKEVLDLMDLLRTGLGE